MKAYAISEFFLNERANKIEYQREKEGVVHEMKSFQSSRECLLERIIDSYASNLSFRRAIECNENMPQENAEKRSIAA